MRFAAGVVVGWVAGVLAGVSAVVWWAGHKLWDEHATGTRL